MEVELEGCDVCGNNHATEDCPILAVDEINDQTNVQSRARMTVPANLEVIDEPDSVIRVVTKKRFEPKQRLGPFEAKRTTQKIDIENGFILKAFGKDNTTVWLDTSDENNCNWLSLVRTADTTRTQNLMAVQLGTDIFYIVTKVVEPGTELRVWYAPHYARKVGKQTEPDGKTKTLLGQILVSVDNTVIAIGSDISPIKLQSIWKQTTGDKDADSLGLSWQTIQAMLSQADNQNNDGDNGSVEDITWGTSNKGIVPRIAYVKHLPNEPGVRSCRHCDAQFDTLEELACHVKDHLKMSVYDSKVKVKEVITPRPTKRKRGRPRKRPKVDQEEVEDDITVAAPYVAMCSDVQPSPSQGNALNADIPNVSDVADSVLNISGDGYSIVVRGPESAIPQVHLEQISPDPVITEHDFIEPASVSVDENTEGNLAIQEATPTPEKAPTARIKRPCLVQASRRGQRGQLSKNCTMIIDDNKRFIYQCNHCTLLFVKLGLFSRHMTEEHESVMCDTCQTVFPNRNKLLEHACVAAEVTSAEDTKDLQSDICVALNIINDTTTGEHTEDATVVEHVDENQEAVFSCQICSKSFEKRIYLKRHMRGHSNVHMCQKCGRRFVRKESLQKHTCFKGNGNGESVGAPAGDDKDLYHCEFCGVSFAKQSYLLRHMATHTGEFSCKHCDRMFSRKESMLQHIKKFHPEAMNSTDIKVFSCEQCHRVFSKEVTLQNHQKLHEGAHRCEQCGRCFATVFSLEKHNCGILLAHKDGFQCKECRKVFDNEGKAQQHLAKHSQGLVCGICGSHFTQRSLLQQHLEVCSAALHGDSYGSFLCVVCDVSFPDSGSFRMHYKQHSHPYKCDKCEKLFLRISNLRRHKCAPVQLGKESVACEICSRKFSTARVLQRHMTVHNPPKYNCEACKGKFTRIDFYNNHMCISKEGKPVQIQRDFKREDFFAMSLSICPICGKSYTSVSNLNKHMKTHGAKKETCDVCGKRFHLKIALREHMQSVHTDEYKYTCQYCGKSMKCRNSLFGHVRQFHSSTIIMYECESCGKQFRQKGNLKKHQLTHSTIKTFVCKDCPKKFKYPDQLKRHEIWHMHGERFTCEFCEKKFVMQFELRKHVQWFHTGLYYVCKYCNQECKHQHSMKRHLLHRHSEEPEWQVNTCEYIKQLVPNSRRVTDRIVVDGKQDDEIDAAEQEDEEEEMEGQQHEQQQVVEMSEEEAALINVTNEENANDEVEETTDTALMDNAMLAAQLQAQIHDPSLPLDSQPFIVAEVAGLVGGDPHGTQTVIIQTSGQQFDNELMSQEVCAALQSLSNQQSDVGAGAFTIIQNHMPLDEEDPQATDHLQEVDEHAAVSGPDQPFLLLPMVTEAGNITEPATGFEATAQITTVTGGI